MSSTKMLNVQNVSSLCIRVSVSSVSAIISVEKMASLTKQES